MVHSMNPRFAKLGILHIGPTLICLALFRISFSICFALSNPSTKLQWSCLFGVMYELCLIFGCLKFNTKALALCQVLTFVSLSFCLLTAIVGPIFISSSASSGIMSLFPNFTRATIQGSRLVVVNNGSLEELILADWFKYLHSVSITLKGPFAFFKFGVTTAFIAQMALFLLTGYQLLEFLLISKLRQCAISYKTRIIYIGTEMV